MDSKIWMRDHLITRNYLIQWRQWRQWWYVGEDVWSSWVSQPWMDEFIDTVLSLVSLVSCLTVWGVPVLAIPRLTQQQHEEQRSLQRSVLYLSRSAPHVAWPYMARHYTQWLVGHTTPQPPNITEWPSRDPTDFTWQQSAPVRLTG